MKVLILDFITSIGGVQSVEYNIIKKLVDKVEMFFLDPYKSSFHEKVSKINNLNIVNLYIWPNIKSLNWNIKYFRPIILLVMGPSYVIFLIRLCYFIKKNSINLLYVNTKKSSLIAFLIKGLLKIDYIYHAHGYNSSKDISNFYKTVINNSRSIICVSDSVKETLIERGINSKKIKTIYNGINVEEIRAKGNENELSMEISDKKKIICVASLHQGKGIHLLIEAFNNIQSEIKDIELIIVGETPSKIHVSYKNDLLEMSKKVNKNNIKFIGWTNNPYKYISKSDVLVLPSIVKESFGMVLVEAMCLGKIVIGSNIGGIPEVIIDGKTGFLFNCNDVKELEKVLRDTLNNNLYSTSHAFLEQYIQEKFTIDNQVEKIYEIIIQKKDEKDD
ncbi:glycosyltransferase family 4 protein [Turicibacter bilis]|uniref:Glycosyltransferase family 4 protein n=1 Tax=Turicibacter bilis TaxID=2735723 RepID=A0A9Q9FGI9_9FIRM|nr:glycosyltransferase family 4 protein [Turicibacter bilis]MBS3198661.1 glycosyltransferase family 4 protein [Turicibacter bilis]UUF08320.1 glycosyltransferase family 4 protein [Turicibacter bilis]